MMARFKVEACWLSPDGNRTVDHEVDAPDACEALNWALPGMYRSGQFSGCVIKIQQVDEADRNKEAGW